MTKLLQKIAIYIALIGLFFITGTFHATVLSAAILTFVGYPLIYIAAHMFNYLDLNQPIKVPFCAIDKSERIYNSDQLKCALLSPFLVAYELRKNQNVPRGTDIKKPAVGGGLKQDDYCSTSRIGEIR